MLHRSLKRNLVIGLAALVVAACAGGAYAATQNSGPTSRQAFERRRQAPARHAEGAQLRAERRDPGRDSGRGQGRHADPGPGERTRAAAQEQRHRAAAAAHAGPRRAAPTLRRRWPAAPGSRRTSRRTIPWTSRRTVRRPVRLPRRRPGCGGELSRADLHATAPALSAGKSLAEIATANGKTVAGLEQAITAQVKRARRRGFGQGDPRRQGEPDSQPAVSPAEAGGQPEGPPHVPCSRVPGPGSSAGTGQSSPVPGLPRGAGQSVGAFRLAGPVAGQGTGQGRALLSASH